MQQGLLLQQQNNLSSALRSFEKAKKIGPRIYDVWFAIGNLYTQMGNAEKAAIAYDRATKISPDNFVAHGQLGVALYNIHRLEDAIVSYKKVIALQPDNIQAYANLAITYLDMGSREEAVASCLHAIKLNPEFIGVHLLLASAYSSLGQYEKALETYDRALAIEHNNFTAIAGKADSLIKLGQKKESYALLKDIVRAEGVDPSIVISYASACSNNDCKEEAARYLEKALTSPKLSQKQCLQLHFAAGRLYDQMNNYDIAFQHYEKGNKLVHRSYDVEKDSKLVDDIIRVFSEPGASLNKQDQIKPITPVFIIGMPRSGTSLVERILGSHSNIFPAGELGEVPKIVERLEDITKKTFPDCMADITDMQLEKLSNEHLEYLTKISNGSGIVTDKLPHNFLFLGLISRLFPNAIIIHCKRNALDTCLSNYFQYFSSSLSYPYDQINLAKHYNNYRRIMKHWGSVIQLPLLELEYEELVKDQKDLTISLLSFLGLPLENSCLAFNTSKHVTRTASYEQVIEPIYTRSVGRWRNYEKHISVLIDTIIDE